MGFSSGPSTGIPKPKVIVPSKGSTSQNLEKFMMMYTCKICGERNANMISKVAYTDGMVISTCRGCKNKHLIADNQRKLDFPSEYGRRVEEYLESRGERVQRLQLSMQDLEDHYLVDKDGEICMVPKMAGQPDPSATIVDVSERFSAAAPRTSYPSTDASDE